MDLHVFEHVDKLSEAVAMEIASFIKSNPNVLLCFAAGDTPLAAYARLVDMHKSGEVDLHSVYFIGLDEWGGLGRNVIGSCAQVMGDTFYDPASIPSDRRLAFDGGRDDLENQCEQVNRFIETHGGIGLTVLGIGMNGHVGFNEPGADPEANAHTVPLDSTTLNVGKKYFVDVQVPKLGVTVGLKQLIGAKKVILMVSEAKKANIVAKTLLEPICVDVPSSQMRKAVDLSVWLDRAAAAELFR